VLRRPLGGFRYRGYSKIRRTVRCLNLKTLVAWFTPEVGHGRTRSNLIAGGLLIGFASPSFLPSW
jgi:hypothetical protein